MIYFKIHGGVAQLGERLPCKQEVRSSTLLISTNNSFTLNIKVNYVYKSLT